MANEEQTTEIEVLQSIYEGDSCFHMINDTTFQYKFGEDGEKTAFLLEVHWPPEYPEVIPSFSLNAFYNNHISSSTKTAMLAAINEEAIKNVGDPQVYTIFEWARYGMAEIIESAEPPVPLTLRLDDGNEAEDDDRGDAKETESDGKGKLPKKEALTKSQKRKEWNRLDNKGEKIRGHDWIDVIKHLSQTGSKGYDVEVPMSQSVESPLTE